MNPDDWRDRVGRHLEHRRQVLGYSSRYQVADGIPVSESWVRQMESGEVRRNDGSVTTPNPRGNKVLAYLDRLGWPPDAIDRLLAGAPPDALTELGPADEEGSPPWDEILQGQREISDRLERLAELLERDA